MASEAARVPAAVTALCVLALVTAAAGVWSGHYVLDKLDDRHRAGRLAENLERRLQDCRKYDFRESCYHRIGRALAPLSDDDPRKQRARVAIAKRWNEEQEQLAARAIAR